MKPQTNCSVADSGLRLKPAILALALAVIALTAYWPATRGVFIWDDTRYIVENKQMASDDGLRHFWLSTETTDYWPLTSSVLWFEWRLWAGRPAPFHLVNILLHAASAVVLWRVLKRLGVPGGWLGAALFAAHPVGAASVAWITELKNVLSLFLCLLSLGAYLRFDETGRRRWYAAALALFLLALLAKTSVVALAPVLLLIAWWRRGAIRRVDELRCAPYFALALLLGLITVWFQWHNALHENAGVTESLAWRAAGAGMIVWFYLYKLLIPAGLCAVYPLWNLKALGWMAFVPLLLLAGAFAILWTRRSGWGRAPLFALGCFVIALGPVLGFIPMSFMLYSRAADHLQYPAMVAILALLAAGAAKLGKTGAFLGACAVLAVMALTWQRAALYQDARKFWEDDLSKNPNSWQAWDSLAHAYMDRGQPERALPCLDEVERLRPGLARERYDRGTAFLRLGRAEDAREQFSEVIALQPNNAGAYHSRGFAWYSMRRPAEAVRDFDRAIALDPGDANAYLNRGNALADLHRDAAALGDFDKAITINPRDANAYYNRGTVLESEKRFDDAVRDYSQAIALNPRHFAAYCRRAAVYSLLRRFDEAVRDYSRAIAIEPARAEAYAGRAAAWQALGENGRARADSDTCETLRSAAGNPAPGSRP